MDNNIYNEQRATILNALYCSVRAAVEISNATDEERMQWIVDDLEVAKLKINVVEEEMRKRLGDPSVDEKKEVG